ncbi:MAG: M1 family metallopeptidase [Saprospiraceae bacterium]|nr:M1 family metallopeptidase [Candidatus Vicinibacter affinis]
MKYQFFILLLCLGCKEIQPAKIKDSTSRPDPHSFSRPDEARTVHLDLDIACDFELQQIIGVASYTISHQNAHRIIFDNLGLTISKVEIEDEKGRKQQIGFTSPDSDTLLGSSIEVIIRPDTRKVHLHYSTSKDAMALQWLDSNFTSSHKFPFLFTQSQSIYARSWIPCQDGPGIRFSYTAKVRVPKGMMAVMSAENGQIVDSSGIYSFKMDKPVPAYLMALAVGDFKFLPLGKRTGVYAEAEIIHKAAYEFEDLEKMVESAEKLYGPYPWGRYDVIVLPTGFPFGGMENPRLTFLTPTVIAGDRSLTSLLAHELAHSWSGNLVTNATWEDFWLNEGFTTYFESRIMESMYGKPYADMLSLLGYQDLQKTIHEMGDTSHFTQLKLNLKDVDPEEALSDIAYEKGKLLLRFLEERLGRERWDPFLKSYFAAFQFQSNTTEGFLQFFDQAFPDISSELRDTVQKWVYEPGLISFKPTWDNGNFQSVENKLRIFLENNDPASLGTGSWSTHEWLHFIRMLPIDQSEGRIKALDAAFKLSASGNSEIAHAWLLYIVRSGMGPKYMKEIERFLGSVGRRKFLTPIYEALVDQGLGQQAREIFQRSKKIYHPLTISTQEKVLYPKI